MQIASVLPFVRPSSPSSNRTPTNPPARIGVMGGMGPAAAAQFMLLLVSRHFAARCDQDHVPAVLDQATDVPDRTRAIAGGGDNPVPAMLASLQRLHAAGATHLVITCNTAHHFVPQIEAAIPALAPGMKLLHIVDASLASLDRQLPGAERVGLLATAGTLSSGVYTGRGAARGWVLPTEAEVNELVMPGIYDGVKAGNRALGRSLLLQAARNLVDRGAQAILLACTEIPLVMQTGDIQDAQGHDVPLIDTLEALADSAVAVHAQSRRPGSSVPKTLARTPAGSDKEPVLTE